MTKALLIKSTIGQKENVRGQWHIFEQAAPYIQGIEAGDILENLNSEVINSMVSGLPNVWSRAYMFAYAFKYTRKEAVMKTGGLIQYYQSLIDEWTGLAALLALHPGRISVSEPLRLNGNRSSFYDIAGSFGDMLFDDIDLWCNPDQLAQTKKEEPFVQIIYYNDVAVGATSPHTLFFTSVDYSTLPESLDIAWYRNGRFQNPLKYGLLSDNQYQKLALFIARIIKKLPDFENKININRGSKDKLSLAQTFVFLKGFLEEIKNCCPNISDEGIIDAQIAFAQPFAEVFNADDKLYYSNGVFTFNENGGIPVDLHKLLLTSNFIYAFSPADEFQPLEDAAVWYLRAVDPTEPNKTWYFPIPLTDYALRIFKNKIGDLVNPSGPDVHELRAVIKPGTFKLTVELYLNVDGRRLTPVAKEFEIKTLPGTPRNVIMWPDFVSDKWNNYYLYNEYPSNSPEVKFMPFYRNYNATAGFDAGDYIVDEKQNLVYADQRMRDDSFQAAAIVKYPAGYATAEDFPYEIIRSNKPFAGVEIRSWVNGNEVVSGYLIIKTGGDEITRSKIIKDFSHETGFENVVIGIDFGSNNSCVTYSKSGVGGVIPVKFKNRRVFISGSENIDPRGENTAKRNELLFFQNEEQYNGQIKSRVHDHDRKYVPEGMSREEIAGGVPVFEQNLRIHAMDERTITTNAGILHHNMKWLTDASGKEKKKAFLKSVWIAVIADLYAEKLIPAELRWSYPGSFSKFEKLQYQQMYNELADLPITGLKATVSNNPLTEAEAVCNYALNNAGLESENIFLGIDVGGSTSDALVVALNRCERAFKLEKQSSIRLAAGMFVNTAAKSENFRRAVYKYHESPECKFTVADIKNMLDNPQTAPFYINSVLDKLKDNEFEGFYRSISQSSPEILALPAYITGALIFYGAMLVKQTVIKNNLTEINSVDLLPFGKGGRLFDWLDVFPGKDAALKYYSDCFDAGFGQEGTKLKFRKRDSIRKDNKSEVSMGLSAPGKVTTDESVKFGSDVIGENGYKYYPVNKEPVELKFDDLMKPEYLEEMDFGIDIPRKFEKFETFLSIFCQFTGPTETGILRNASVIEKHKDDLAAELKAYITGDSEWQKADALKKEGQPFDFLHSPFMSEAMCFLEKFIVDRL